MRAHPGEDYPERHIGLAHAVVQYLHRDVLDGFAWLEGQAATRCLLRMQKHTRSTSTAS